MHLTYPEHQWLLKVIAVFEKAKRLALDIMTDQFDGDKPAAMILTDQAREEATKLGDLTCPLPDPSI